jgi:hypothetical protein
MSTTSQWAGVLEKDPCQALVASLALADVAHFDFLTIGDLNVRISALAIHPRNSMDEGDATQRGGWLCKLLNDYNSNKSFARVDSSQSSLAVLNVLARIAANLPPSKVSAKVRCLLSQSALQYQDVLSG